ncbi:MAG TPA: bifunctional diguanylate cyclase/phosphodiesterase [Aestuariivirga sp.]|nr:bifunctional diguanylate cyclase/phosphodiesterase [Aestuariivirga sp.]
MRAALLFRRSIIIAAVGMVVLGCAVLLGINTTVNRAVSADGDYKAREWADYFIEQMPNLDRLIATGNPDARQNEIIKTAATVGDVFRFKLYNRRGDLTLVSDEGASTVLRASEDDSANAVAVMASGVSNISLEDGTGKENRPPVYVEAYVPIIDNHGGIRGVVEVYIDQTATASLLKTSFAALSLGLALAAALTFGLPMLAYLLRSRQAREARQRVDYLAHYEPMTGLLNRTSFTERLDSLLRKGGSGQNLALVLLDVDDFKAINDAHGHEAGDEFLKHVAECITGLCRESDLAARPGGDEFIIALPDRSEAEAVALVEQLMRCIVEPIVRRGKSISGKLSVGIYMVDCDADVMADALHKADVALYQAKADGRNTYRLFSEELESGMQARRELEQLIARTAEEEGFELNYQPLIQTDSRACAGFEALLRLPDGKGGYISPATYIPVIEAMGLINKVGKWVIEEATRTAATWPSHLFVSVNLSVRQFEDDALVGHVKNALLASGLRPKQLELEVTETLLMHNTDFNARQLSELRELGVAISMDDFGTGYSSLGYLWQFRFDKLKIDRSFVAALNHHDRKAREILDTIIMLAHKLDMTVTAEGVETAHQADVLAELACDHVQGFLYGRPAPASEIALFLLQNTRTRLAPKQGAEKNERKSA